MRRKVFVNMPVKDLQASIDFFAKLGWAHEPMFTDETASCIVISEEIYAMVITEPRFQEFTKGEVADGRSVTEFITALSCDSRAEVDELADKALAAGAASGSRRWTRARCTAAPSPTSTATPGSWSTWT